MVSRTSASTGLIPSVAKAPRALPAIVVGGLIVGVLDLLYAIVVYSPRRPILVPQTIAGGLLGPARAYGGGTGTAVLGTVLHFLIALVAASAYYVASRKVKLLRERPILSGMIYGALVYAFMHIIVLPLSALPHDSMPAMYQVCEFVEHCSCVGLPISLSVRHFSS